MKHTLILLSICLFALAAIPVEALQAQDNNAGQFDVLLDDKGVAVNLNGKLLTRYLRKSGAKPVLYPLIGPDEVALTRNYPVADTALEEEQDHPHHRSVWFTHGDVNGISFWHEEDGHGVIEHAGFTEISGGESGRIVTKNNWMHPKSGDVICTDVRELEFGVKGEVRWIDFDVVVTAGEKPVSFGDTKEGTFGIRVAASMKVTAELGGKITNSRGQTNKATWGRPAEWVDYTGPIRRETTEGDNPESEESSDSTYGIAIMNHPDSHGFPTHWHVREYGLFAANPFGLHDFYATDDKKRESKKDGKTSAGAKDGTVKLAPGESLKFRYRVLLHKGNAKEAQVAEHFSQYSGQNE